MEEEDLDHQTSVTSAAKPVTGHETAGLEEEDEATLMTRATSAVR